MGRFEIKPTSNDGWMFNLLASNHQVICTSQVYTTVASCKVGVESVRKNCSATVEDRIVDGYEALRNPKYELYTDTAGKYRFRLKAANGEIVAASQGYTNKSSALNGISSIGEERSGCGDRRRGEGDVRRGVSRASSTTGLVGTSGT